LNAIVPKIINLDYSKSTRPRLVTPVKSQGSCGSCWAFAGIAEIESYFLSKYKLFLDLSEQQMVDCLPAVQKGNLGCGGGFLDSVGYYASLYPIAQ
jgi:Papain family cysteine protease